MPYSTPNKTILADAVTPAQVVAGSGIRTETTTERAASTASATPVQASRLVHEIRDIAERVSSVDRNSVEVRFDFNDNDRLTVRVEYRDGTVQTTFNTNSTELRDAISREWTAQAAVSDNRNYKLADPVFTSSDASQQTASFSSGSESGFSRSSQEQQQQQGSTGYTFTSSGRFGGSGSSSTAAGSARPAVRPETSRLLHTFA